MDMNQLTFMVAGAVGAYSVQGAVGFIIRTIFKRIDQNAELIKEKEGKAEQANKESNEKSEKGDLALMGVIDEFKNSVRRDIDSAVKDIRSEIESGYSRLQIEVENRRQGEISMHNRIDSHKEKQHTIELERAKKQGELEAKVEMALKYALPTKE